MIKNGNRNEKNASMEMKARKQRKSVCVKAIFDVDQLVTDEREEQRTRHWELKNVFYFISLFRSHIFLQLTPS